MYNLVTSLVYRFYVNCRSCSEKNSVCSNKWAFIPTTALTSLNYYC